MSLINLYASVCNITITNRILLYDFVHIICAFIKIAQKARNEIYSIVIVLAKHFRLNSSFILFYGLSVAGFEGNNKSRTYR